MTSLGTRRNGLKRGIFHLPLWAVPVFLLVGYLIVILVWRLIPDLHEPEFLYAAGGGLTAIAAFFFTHHLESARFHMEIFTKFTGRYDELNEFLHRLGDLPPEAEIAPEDRRKLYDYFNLCGEESFFHRLGYVRDEVWDSWVNGMAIHYGKAQIREIWEEEMQTESYYGFGLDEVRAAYQSRLRRNSPGVGRADQQQADLSKSR